jgi:LytS/YehU family sensor histidine kinase
MLIQPYVENALKHGLLHRKTNRNLKVNFFLNEDSKTVKCIIVDNGVGRDKAEEYKARSHKNHKSFATKATQDRLDLLNYGKEKQVGVTITDLFEKQEPIGTQVDIVIPFTID